MDYDGLMEKAEEANRIIPESTPSSVVADFKAKTGELFHDISEMNPEEIEETVKCHVQAKIDEYAYYSRYRSNEWECLVKIQEGQSIEGIDHGTLQFAEEIKDRGYYIVYSWGSGNSLLDELDIRGH